mmetsp:Transcript_68138/g.133661  ORF Transcript_68138/g.133661 Transcript_68138/m.133661 type:complete len:107 (+) Transcript_68138:668-988(+)
MQAERRPRKKAPPTPQQLPLQQQESRRLLLQGKLLPPRVKVEVKVAVGALIVVIAAAKGLRATLRFVAVTKEHPASLSLWNAELYPFFVINSQNFLCSSYSKPEGG